MKYYARSKYIIPDTWNGDKVSLIFLELSTDWYEKYGSFPQWFPYTEPNFDNMKMPKHAYICNKINVFKFKCNPDKNYLRRDMILWIYENCTGVWDYKWDYDVTMCENLYLNNKEDAILFKLRWNECLLN